MDTAAPQLITTAPIALPPLNDGEVWIGIVSADRKLHHVILLPGDFAGDHAAMLAKAAELGGDLPSRLELNLLYTEARDRLQRDWYWSNEKDAGEPRWAWCQDFLGGTQYRPDVGRTLRAVAVRRVSIQ